MVGWERVCKPKELGGLEIENIAKRNKEFIMKWLWRFPLERNSLWHKVIKSKYSLSEN